MRERSRSGVPWAGLAAGAGAWAISSELNYVLATVHCEDFAWARATTALATLALCAGGIALTWPAWRSVADEGSVSARMPRRLIAGVSILAGIIFALAIAAQGLALFFLGCSR